MSRVVRYSIIFLIFFSSSKVFALIDFEDAIYPELAPAARALAMGNAYVCKVDDAVASFYNPAGLGTVRNTHFHITNFTIETNKDYIKLGGNKATDVLSDLSGKLSLNGTRKLLLQNRGKIAHSRFHVMPNFTTRYFSVGYLFAQRSRSTIGVEDDAQFEYAFRQDHGPYASLNLSLGGGILKFGWTSIILNRKEVNDQSPRNLGIIVEDAEFKKGTAVVSIAGGRLTLPIVWLPTFAATIHNVLENDFSSRAAGQPTNIKRNIVLGASVTPQIANTIRMHLEFNWKDFTMEHDGVAFTRRYAFGAEIDFARRGFIRFGYGDGYGSGGIGFKSQTMEMDLSTYAVDTTTQEYRGKEDRRFVLGISSGF